MKLINISVLALVGLTSAHGFGHHHHRHHLAQAHKQSGIKNKLYRVHNNGPPYPDTRPGRQWYELADFTERIHGSEPVDDATSPYDPEVVDAPEDIKRVGNDHESLHNAKLSPDGYYNGFFHKDHEGNYVQKASQHGHKKRHLRLRNQNYLS